MWRPSVTRVSGLNTSTRCQTAGWAVAGAMAPMGRSFGLQPPRAAPTTKATATTFRRGLRCEPIGAHSSGGPIAAVGSGKRRTASMEVGRALESAAGAAKHGFFEVPADQLQAERQALLVDAAGQADGR